MATMDLRVTTSAICLGLLATVAFLALGASSAVTLLPR